VVAIVAAVLMIVAAVLIAVVGCIFCVVVAHCVGVDTRAHSGSGFGV